MDERELIRAYVQTRSEEAFAALVQKHANWIYALCLQKLKHQDLADEATQAVFIVMSQRASAIPPDRPLSGWLYKTARFAVARMMRTEMRKRNLDRKVRALSTQAVTNDPQASGWETFDLLGGALESLKEHERDAVLLRFYENKTLAEAGSALGISEAAAEKRVSRAIDRLKDYFGQHGVVLSLLGITHLLTAAASSDPPPELFASIVRTALKNAGAGSLTGAAGIAKGVIKSMFWNQWKAALIASVVVAVAAASAFGVFGADGAAMPEARNPHLSGLQRPPTPPTRPVDAVAPTIQESNPQWAQWIVSVMTGGSEAKSRAGDNLVQAGPGVLPSLKRAWNESKGSAGRASIEEIRKRIYAAHPEMALKISMPQKDQHVAPQANGIVYLKASVENIADQPITLLKRNAAANLADVWTGHYAADDGKEYVELSTSITGAPELYRTDDFAVLQPGDSIEMSVYLGNLTPRKFTVWVVYKFAGKAQCVPDAVKLNDDCLMCTLAGPKVMIEIVKP